MTLPGLHRYTPLLKWLGVASIAMFVISILLIPWLIQLLPADYFVRSKNLRSTTHIPSIVTLILALLRNIFGVLLLLAGFAMLFLPGQGILTMIIGISLLDFPGKHDLLQRLTQRPSVQQAMNWIRAKTKRPPFIWK